MFAHGGCEATSRPFIDQHWSRTCAIGVVGVSSVDPAASRDRLSACPPRFRKRIPHARRSPGVSRGKSADRAIVGAYASVRERRSATGTRRDVRGGENQSSRVDHRDISLGRTRARPCRRYRTRRRAAWKFYQYRGGHLVSLAVAREKLRAERRTTDRSTGGARRASRLTNRRGLPE